MQRDPEALSHFRRALLFLFLGGLWILPLWLTSEAFVGSRTDMFAYQYPMRQFAFQHLRHGQWPLWNPYIFSGLPFLATGFQSPLHPLSWIAAALSPVLEVKVSIWLCLALAGWTMSGLLGELGLSSAASLLGGVLWMGGAQPCQRIYAGNLDVLLGFSHMAWLPWMLLVALRSGLRGACLSAAVLALCISTGHYHMAYLTGCLAVWLTLRQATLPRWSAVWLGTAALGLAITAFQWISLPSMLAWSSRSQMTLQESGSIGARVPAFLTLFWPRLFEGIVPHTSWCDWPGWEGQLYVGLLTLPLALRGARSRPLWAAGGLLFALLAAGLATPLYPMLFAIDPLASKFRAPFRFSIVSLALLICLAARGYDEVGEDRRRFGWMAGLALALWSGVTLLHPGAESLYASLQGVAAPDGQWSLLLWRGLPNLILSALGLVALLWAPGRWRGAAVAFCLGLDLWLLACPLWITAPFQDAEMAGDLLSAVRQTPGARLAYTPELSTWIERGLPYGVSAAGGFGPQADWRYLRALKLALGVDPEQPGTLASPYADSPFWNLQGVRYAIGLGRLPGADFQPVSLASIEPLQLYENPKAKDRAFLVYQAEVAKPAEALDAIARGTLDASEQVVVDSGLFDRILKHLGDQQGEPVRGKVEHLQLEADLLSLDVTTVQPAVLVVTDTPSPGWTASLDGQSVELLAVNGCLHRAVLVPGGQHHVEMRYVPAHWRLGCWISILAGLLTLGWAGSGWRRTLGKDAVTGRGLDAGGEPSQVVERMTV